MTPIAVLTLVACSSFGSDISVDNDEDTSVIVNRFKQDLERDDVLPTQDADDTLACAIEWVRLTDSAEHTRLGGKADYFLGFVSGRMRVSPPKWWSRGVRRGTHSPDGTTFDCHGIQKHWKGEEGGWRFSGFEKVSAISEELVLEFPTQKLSLKKSSFSGVGAQPITWNHEDDGAVSGAMHGDICAIAFECPTFGMGGPRHLYCLDAKTNQILWMREIATGSPPPFGLGGAVNGGFTEVHIDGNRVIVWIGHDFSMCFEVFRKQDGKRLARFSSGHLDEIHLGSKQK